MSVMSDFATKTNKTEDIGVKTSFEDLNEYVMIRIFGYLSVKERVRLTVVSLKWKDCIEKSFKSQLVLNRLTFGSDSDTSEQYLYRQTYGQNICRMIQKCCNVKHISLRGIYELRIEDIIDTIVSNCSQLQSIDFGGSSYNKRFENPLYFGCLREISSSGFGDKALNSIIDSENLECIDIRDNEGLKTLDFKRMGPKIKRLNLSESGVFEYNVIKGLTEGNGTTIEFLTIDIKETNVLRLICDNLLKLKELSFCLYSKNCDFKRISNLRDLECLLIHLKYFSLKSQEFTDLMRSLKNSRITELSVYNWPNSPSITDDSIEEIRVNCPLIKSLAIRCLHTLTDIGMYAISQMKNITTLDLKDCHTISDEMVIVIIGCPTIRKLILHNCSHITNSTIDAFIAKAKELPKDNFYLDVIETNVSEERLPIVVERPKNLKLLYDYEECIYNCDHQGCLYEDVDCDSDCGYGYGSYSEYYYAYPSTDSD